MANYKERIITALTALNKQRDILSKARDDGKQLVGKALENGDEIGNGFGSALSAIEDRRKTLTAIIGLEELAATTVDIEEALKPLVLPSFANSDGIDDPEANNETGGQVNNDDDDDWITIPSDEDDIDAPTKDAPTPISASPDAPQPTVKRPTTTRKRRPTRSKGNDGITFSDYGGVDTLIKSPTIVKLKDGSFVELRCDICGGNTSWAHNTVISGIRGFQAHYRLMHQITVKVDKVLQRCKHRDVPDEEAQRIINGEHQIGLIHCESKVNLKSDTVYVGQSAVASGNVPKRGARTVEEVAAARARADSKSKNSKRKRATQAIDSAVDSADDSAPSPKPKKSLKRDRSAPHLSNCPIIVQIPSNNDSSNPDTEGTFIELRCDTCHGNGSFSSGKLLYGIKGFKAHYREIHKEHLGTADILTRCRFRQVESEEVRAIQAGVKGLGFVRCQGSPNVRPKKSYRDFVVEAV